MALELRDLEILRALVRVRYLTTRQLHGPFFGHLRVLRRRMQALSERGLIRRHERGWALQLP